MTTTEAKHRYEQGRITVADAIAFGREVNVLNVEMPWREVEALLEAAEQAREALRLTREYVGEEALPAIEGWSWFDADNTLRAAIEAARA